MEVTYTGPDAQVTLAPRYGGITFPNGEPVNVPDELGQRLLEQATFEEAKPARKRTSAGDDDVQDRG